MRQLLLTTALLLPLAGLALAQTADIATEEAPVASTPAEVAAQKAAKAARSAAEAAAIAAGSAAEAAKAAIEDKTGKVEEKAAQVSAGAAEVESKLADSAEARAALRDEMANSDKIVRKQAANELRVDWINGALVKSPKGEDIGQVRDLIVDAESGQMIAAIIGVGGLLGIGEKQIAVPWDQLTVNSDAQTISTTLTAAEAMAAPNYAFRQREAAAPAAKADAAHSGDASSSDSAEPAGETGDDMPAESDAESIAH
ncbi:MAG: PRC-barrel domain-containing protein [Paracoccus sp. (in: a-proteobacteria)]